MKIRSLHFKLTWIHSTAIALIWSCIGLVRYQLVSYRSNIKFDEALLHDGQLFISRFRSGPADFTWSLDGLGDADAFSIQELEPYFVITDLQGRVLFGERYRKHIEAMISEGELKAILPQTSGFGRANVADGTELRFVSLPLPSGILAEPAVMHIGRSMEPLNAVLHEYLAFYLYSVPLMLAISVGVGWFLAGRAIKPFGEITRTVEKITYENLNTQVLTEHKEEEIQRLVQSFNAMVRRLNDSFQHMRKFNADAAHELRTPLAILRGETELALRTPDLPEEIHSVLASSLEELERLTRIVNDMLMLAEAEAGRQVLVMEPVNLPALLVDLVDQMHLLALDRNVLIDVRCKPDLWIDADKLWFRRALVNLVDNAIKYSKSAGTIEISAAAGDSMVHVVIKDNGMGIQPDDLPYIFNRLYRADPARSRVSGGAGLGLALVKWIVEAHKGTIQVTSQLDQGTSFEITLPARNPNNN